MLRALSAKKNLFSVARMLQTLGIAVLPGAVHSSNPSSPSSGLHAHYQGLDDLYPNAGSDSDEDPELDNFSRLFSGTELQELNELSKSLRPTPKIYDDRCFALFLKDPRVVKVVSGWINDKQLESKDGYSDCKGDVFELAVLDKWCKFRSGIPNSHNKERMFVERVIMKLLKEEHAYPEFCKVDLASTKVKKVPWHALKFLDGYCEAWELKITPTDANIVEIQTHLFNNIRSLSLHGGDLDLIPKLTNFTGMKKLDLRENRIENLTFKAYLKGQEEGDRTNICLASKN